MRFCSWICLLLSLLGVCSACTGSIGSSGRPDGDEDAPILLDGTDGTGGDAGTMGDDGSVTDAGQDAGADAGADPGPDAGQDDGGDASTDAGSDAGTGDGDGSPGRVLQVGPTRTYKTPCQAAAAARDGDTIEIDAGEYLGDVCAWTRNDLTIRGVGGMAHLRANGAAYGGKAIWVIQGDHTTVEWIEFSGCTVPDQNGAGIRQEGTGLTVRHCSFHDNEDGILAGDDPESDILIEYSEFARNGYGDGQSHNLYINHVRRFTFRFNYSHAAHQGHELKSRAYENVILYNRISDEAGDPSYTVQLPNGGLSIVIGNLLEQGPDSPNHTLFSYGDEGLTNPTPQLFMVNNTLVNDYDGGTFVRIAAGATATLTNNLFVGSGTRVSGTAQETNDLSDANGACLSDRAGFDYHLVAGCPAIDAGADPGSAAGFDLVPRSEYLHPCAEEPRPASPPLDVGAYEFR
ncbi:MAG: hypothetical protein GYA21_00865 [Myxococcales bacterium]|nr:hypothetical protein [Myxococcales bacterium]